jgi:hypothetical protein
VNGYWVILSNSGGELERHFVENEEEAAIKAAVVLMGLPCMYDGDSIVVKRDGSEQ